jgi:hypothetical protein
LSSSAALIGVTASGVLCSVVVRLVAVTVTSCVSIAAALAAAAGDCAVWAWAAAVVASMARTARWIGDASEARDF